MARKGRVHFEKLIAHHHLAAVFDQFGTPPKGIHVIMTPSTSIADIWSAAAGAIVRDMEVAAKSAKPLTVEDIVDPEADISPYHEIQEGVLIDIVALRWSDGLDTGSDGASCAIYIAEDRDDLDHESLTLADSIQKIELRPELVILAAAECGRTITEAEAELLISMPYARRRIAVTVNRPIEETYDLHVEAAKAESAKLAKAKASLEKKNKKKSPRCVPEGPRLEGLHGYGEAKTWGLELAQDIADAVEGVISWADVDRGMLLSGAPGTGKTTFARALATTCGCHFVSGSYSQWQSAGHQGDMLAAMRVAFEEAREHAPSILLIDEIDGFSDRGIEGRNVDYMRGVVNGLLELLDGSFERDGIIVIGATNNPSIVDPAVRRAGRIDRHVEIGLPDAEDRVAILKQHLGLPPEYDLRLLRTRTEGMSGADLERLARDARRLARRERVAVGHRHLSAALPKRVARTHEQLHRIAVHEIGHALIGVLLGEELERVFVTRDFDPHEQIAGGAWFEDNDVARVRTREWHLDVIARMLGGMAAEQVVFDSHCDGVIADLEHATRNATLLLVATGMGDTLTSEDFRDPGALAAARKFDPRLRAAVEALLQEQLERARQIITEHRAIFDELVELLVQHGRLHGSTVHEAVSRPRLALAQ